MFLKNYWIYLASFNCMTANSQPSSTNSGSYSSAIPFTDMSGAVTNRAYMVSSSSTSGVSGSGNSNINRAIYTNFQARLGTGTAEPSASDYALNNDVTSSFSGVTTAKQYTYTSTGMEVIYTITGLNNSNSAITLTEIGFSKAIYSSVTASDTILMVHQLLTTPITVEAGDSFSVVVKLTIS